MSYILEALRRSQAERERGQVPGLHAPAAPADGDGPSDGERRGVPPWALGAGLGAGALVALALWWTLRPAPAAAPVAVAPAAVPASAPAPAPSPPLPVVVSAPPAPVPAPAPAPVPASAAMPAAVASPAVPTPAPPPRTPTLAELTPDQRRDLPPLVMGGSIWSENVQSRFVIVNGQVVREGEPAAPGVMVERIAPKSVLLKWRELRFEVPL